MDPIPLTEELFKKLDQTAQHSLPLKLSSFFCRHDRIPPHSVFVARTPYAQLPAMPAYMPVEPFEASQRSFISVGKRMWLS